MVRKAISDELWCELQKLLPEFTPSAKGGARSLKVSDKDALSGILFVLQTGIAWSDLPQSMGFGSGMTCWRRLRAWHAAGIWRQLHLAMLQRLRQCDQIDWSRASIDGASVASPRGAWRQAPTPRIEANWAPNATSSRTREGCHLPFW